MSDVWHLATAAYHSCRHLGTAPPAERSANEDTFQHVPLSPLSLFLTAYDKRYIHTEPVSNRGTTARKAVRTAKVGACACTNTWTREAYNLGALGVVITTKTASTLMPRWPLPAALARSGWHGRVRTHVRTSHGA